MFAVRALHAVAANVAILAEDVEMKVGRLAEDVGVVSQDIQGGWWWTNRILNRKMSYFICYSRDIYQTAYIIIVSRVCPILMGHSFSVMQWAGLQIDMAEERMSRRVIRKLAQNKRAMRNGPLNFRAIGL